MTDDEIQQKADLAVRLARVLAGPLGVDEGLIEETAFQLMFRDLERLTRDVERQEASATCFCGDPAGHRLTFSRAPNPEGMRASRFVTVRCDRHLDYVGGGSWEILTVAPIVVAH